MVQAAAPGMSLLGSLLPFYHPPNHLPTHPLHSLPALPLVTTACKPSASPSGHPARPAARPTKARSGWAAASLWVGWPSSSSALCSSRCSPPGRSATPSELFVEGWCSCQPACPGRFVLLTARLQGSRMRPCGWGGRFLARGQPEQLHHVGIASAPGAAPQQLLLVLVCAQERAGGPAQYTPHVCGPLPRHGLPLHPKHLQGESPLQRTAGRLPTARAVEQWWPCWGFVGQQSAACEPCTDLPSPLCEWRPYPCCLPTLAAVCGVCSGHNSGMACP